VQRKTPAKQKAKNSKDDDEPIIYPKLEDEIFKEVDIKACYSDLGCLSLVNANKISLFFQLSSWSFTFPIRSEHSSQQEVSCT
jgi:protein BCP1